MTNTAINSSFGKDFITRSPPLKEFGEHHREDSLT
jgi:hypothetical protein